jgi:hypothetical protein
MRSRELEGASVYMAHQGTSSMKLSTGIIVAVVLGFIVLVAVIVSLIYLARRRPAPKNGDDSRFESDGCSATRDELSTINWYQDSGWELPTFSVEGDIWEDVRVID